MIACLFHCQKCLVLQNGHVLNYQWLGDKIKLIWEQESQPKLSQRELSDKSKIGKSTVGDILKKKQVYLDLYEIKIWTSLSFRKLESTVHYLVAAVKEDPLVALQQALL